MIPRDVKSPTAPIPFHKLLRVVAIVDRDDQQTKELLDHIAKVKELQRLCFRASSFPELAMSPEQAYEALVANDVDYVPLEEAKGRISATLALIYPPGIGVIVPG